MDGYITDSEGKVLPLVFKTRRHRAKNFLLQEQDAQEKMNEMVRRVMALDGVVAPTGEMIIEMRERDQEIS